MKLKYTGAANRVAHVPPPEERFATFEGSLEGFANPVPAWEIGALRPAAGAGPERR